MTLARTNDIIKAASDDTQLKPANPQGDFRAVLARNWGRIKAVMPAHMSQERMYQLAVSAYNTTPKLAECSTRSVLSCIMQCAALGLEPSAVDGLGRAYILPYRNKRTRQYEAQVILGYKGMIDLARKSGELQSIAAHAVYEGDEFRYAYGLVDTLVHVPSDAPKEGRKLTHAYCVAKYRDGGHYFNVLTREDIEAARPKGTSYGPWVDNFEQMACKTAVRRAFPYLPISVEAQRAGAIDETTPDYSAVIDPIITDETETADDE